MIKISLLLLFGIRRLSSKKDGKNNNDKVMNLPGKELASEKLSQELV